MSTTAKPYDTWKSYQINQMLSENIFGIGNSPHSRQVKHVTLFQGDPHRLCQRRICRAVFPRSIWIPSRKRHTIDAIFTFSRTIHHQLKLIGTPCIGTWPQGLLVHTRVTVGRQKDEMFPTLDLHVDVLIVVFVECCDGARVSNPSNAVLHQVRFDPCQLDEISNAAGLEPRIRTWRSLLTTC